MRTMETVQLSFESAKAGPLGPRPPTTPTKRRAPPASMAASAAASAAMEVEEDDAETLAGKTDPKRCKCTGTGLSTAIVRQPASFSIEACNSQGERCSEGGDSFTVQIRAAGVRIRTKLIDHSNGLYTVEYKAESSSRFLISLSLRGRQLPGSPFTCVARSALPAASQCVISGASLTRAVAHITQCFDLTFRDAAGHLTHAEDVDVYVRPTFETAALAYAAVSRATSGRPDVASAAGKPPTRPSAADDEIPAELTLAAASASSSPAPKAAAAAGFPHVTSSQDHAHDAAESRITAGAGDETAGAVDETAGAVDETAGAAAADSHLSVPSASSVPPTRRRPRLTSTSWLKTAEVFSQLARPFYPTGLVVSKTAITVRRDVDLASDRVGSLHPGQLVVLHEVHEHEQQQGLLVRALVGLDPDDPRGMEPPSPRPEETLAASWRDYFKFKPDWLENLPSGAKGSPYSPRSPRRGLGDPVGWVTLSKEGRTNVMVSKHLAAGTRQEHMQAWERRLAVDRRTDIKSWATSMRQLAASVKGAQTTKSSKSLSKDDEDPVQAALNREKKEGDSRPDRALANQRLFLDERRADPTGIGFAFGGVMPGRLHAHGKPHEVHKVYYSVGQVGTYELHVALREQSIPLPGSPFKLEVVPGPASAQGTEATRWRGPLAGTVGHEERCGCTLELQSRDKMGNACSGGDALVECEAEMVRRHTDKPWDGVTPLTKSDPAKKKEVEVLAPVLAKVTDHKNGKYTLSWRSKVSGVFRAHVAIEGEAVIGSPFPIRFMADRPVLVMTVASGGGLKESQAGVAAVVQLQLLDQFSNAAMSDTLEFGITLVAEGDHKEKSKWRQPDIPSLPFKGCWEQGMYVMTYTPERAGSFDLHLWVVDSTPSSERESSTEAGRRARAGGSGGRMQRVALPGSPFKMKCKPNVAHASGSAVDGFFLSETVTDEKASRKVDKAAAAAAATQNDTIQRSGSTVGAGEMILIRPRIADIWGNLVAAQLTAAGESTLRITVQPPGEDSRKVEVRQALVRPRPHAPSLCCPAPLPSGAPLYFLTAEPGYDARSAPGSPLTASTLPPLACAAVYGLTAAWRGDHL